MCTPWAHQKANPAYSFLSHRTHADKENFMQQYIPRIMQHCIPEIITASGLQWLVLACELTERYTNWCDGRSGDTSELVTKVNADPALGAGFTDWRMPTKDELKSHFDSDAAPQSGVFWSSTQHVVSSSGVRYVGYQGGYVYKRTGSCYGYHARLVRTIR
jgi:hypothetical protein